MYRGKATANWVQVTFFCSYFVRCGDMGNKTQSKERQRRNAIWCFTFWNKIMLIFYWKWFCIFQVFAEKTRQNNMMYTSYEKNLEEMLSKVILPLPQNISRCNGSRASAIILMVSFSSLWSHMTRRWMGLCSSFCHIHFHKMFVYSSKISRMQLCLEKS